MTTYFGIKTYKNPLDFWIYQEIIFKTKPDVIIEIGNKYGRCALALAHIQDNMDHGKIIGIDFEHVNVNKDVYNHRE